LAGLFIDQTEGLGGQRHGIARVGGEVEGQEFSRALDDDVVPLTAVAPDPGPRGQPTAVGQGRRDLERALEVEEHIFGAVAGEALGVATRLELEMVGWILEPTMYGGCIDLVARRAIGLDDEVALPDLEEDRSFIV